MLCPRIIDWWMQRWFSDVPILLSTAIFVTLPVSAQHVTGTIDKLTFRLGPSQVMPAEQAAGAAAVRRATD